MSFPFLEVIVFLPLGTALAVALLPKSIADRAAKPLALSAAVVELGFVI